MFGKFIHTKVVFIVCIIAIATKPWLAHGQSHACKGCSAARNSYINAAYESLCDDETGIKARMDRLFNALKKRQQELAILRGLRNKCTSPRQCLRLDWAILRKQAQINGLLVRLLAFARLVARDCAISLRLEERKQCKEREAPKYCSNPDLTAGTIMERIRAAYQAVDSRCDDLAQEKKERPTECPATATPTPTQTPTPTETQTPISTATSTAIATATETPAATASPTPLPAQSAAPG